MRKPHSPYMTDANPALGVASNTKSVSSFEMKELEEKSERLGISKMMMMENAGAAVARYVHEHFVEWDTAKRSRRVKITVVAGTGNNGGDAFVAARHLLYWKRKFRVSLILIGDEEKIQALEARANWEILRRIRAIRKLKIRSVKDLSALKGELKNCKVIIVGIFGTGFRGRPRKLQELAISEINGSKAFRLSIDVPSGMEADSGKCKYGVNSDVTISMHAPKVGMLKRAARVKCGEIVVENVGLAF